MDNDYQREKKFSTKNVTNMKEKHEKILDSYKFVKKRILLLGVKI